MVSINPAPAISVAATEQDANCETRLNDMENAIFESMNTLEKFISTKNSSCKSQRGNDRGYLANFSVNAFQSEIDPPSDDETCVPPACSKETQ